MKTLKTLLCSLLCLTTAAAFSQKNSQVKQKVFSAYPETIQLSKNILQNTLNANEGEEVVVAFSNDFRFKGTVISNRKKYDNLQTVMVKSVSYGNTIFEISKMTNKDKTVSYVGRIINPDAYDGYEIKKDKDDSYSFKKFETNKILQDCSYN